MKRTLLRLLIVAGGVVCMAWGQDQAYQPDQPDEEEGPGRGVARISVMNGDVSLRRGDSGEVVAAALNAPLVAGDQLLTGPNSRAEVQFDWANIVRLAAQSEVRFADLENQRYQIQVARGMVTYRVLRDSNAQVEISTPSVSVRPVQQGAYRIAVREDGTAEITVRNGEAEIFTPRGTERLTSGRTMLARGTPSDPEFQVAQAVPYDEWDRWNEDRDRQLQASRSYNYVSPDIYGAEDLDNYGTWQNDPAYGEVWYPRVADDWAPYRDGRWSWLDWYGWNWVSYDPWGWAPYHYGRWCYTANRGWGWWPGARYGRHYWSPGLVAFVGWDSWGGRRGGLGFGGIGWIPLAPHERYHRWYGNRNYAGYRNGDRYGSGSNLVNNFDFNGGYRNARVRNAVTGVDGQGFVSGRRGSAVQVTDGRLGRASLVRGALPVTPGRESLRLSDRAVRTNNLPQSRNDTRFFSRQQTARVDRVPFEDQRRGMEQMTRRTFGGQQSPALNNSGPAGRNQEMGSVQRGTAPAGNQGWRRFSAPAGGSGQGAVRAPQDRPGAGGWRTPQSTQPGLQGGGVNRNSGSGWSRFGTGSGYSSPRNDSRNDSPGTSSPQTYRGRGQEPMRINPSIVRERAPSSGGASSDYSRPAPNYSGGGGYSQPAPNYGGSRGYSRQAPSYGDGGGYSRPAPSYSGGGGRGYSQPAPNYGGSGDRGYSRQAPSYGGGGYSRPAPSYGGGGGRGYSQPAPRSGGGGNYSRPAPSYGGGGGRGYSQPAPRSGGGGNYSRPAPSYGGGGGRGYSQPAPRSGGGGNYSRPAPSSGGGGRNNGGGGSRQNGRSR